MNRINHTNDSLKLAEFLKDYPNEWHSISDDKKTQKALQRVIELNPGRIEVEKHRGIATMQIRLLGRTVA